MAVQIRPRGHVCPPSGCQHQQPPTGGKCAFFSPGRPGSICGRDSVAVYVNPDAPVRSTYRCARHDRDVAVAAARDLGFERLEVRA
jgi:hypothetical protein